MKAILYIFLLLLIAHNVKAQIDVPYNFLTLSYGEPKSDSLGSYRSINDKGKYYVIRLSDKNVYTLSTNDGTVILRGGVKKTSHCTGIPLKQDGYWTSYYNNGNKKAKGFYNDKSIAIGYWETYYENGTLKETYFLSDDPEHEPWRAPLKTGKYTSYYDNGQIESKGFYTARIDATMNDTLYVEDPVTGDTTLVITKGSKHSFKVGPWYYYDSTGVLLRKEDH